MHNEQIHPIGKPRLGRLIMSALVPAECTHLTDQFSASQLQKTPTRLIKLQLTNPLPKRNLRKRMLELPLGLPNYKRHFVWAFD